MTWTGEGMMFRGGAPGGPEIVVDGDSEGGPSPMDALLISLATCMGADVRMILEKARVPLESLEIEVEGTRRPDAPRRYEEIRLVYRLRGPLEEHAPRLERAVQLSRDTYCSVLHTLLPDLDVEIAIERL
jgi:putative redox protein